MPTSSEHPHSYNQSPEIACNSPAAPDPDIVPFIGTAAITDYTTPDHNTSGTSGIYPRAVRRRNSNGHYSRPDDGGAGPLVTVG